MSIFRLHMVVLSIFTQQTLALKSSFSGRGSDGGALFTSGEQKRYGVIDACASMAAMFLT